MLADRVQVGGVGAYGYREEEEKGYYLVRWTSETFRLQQDTTLDDGTFIPKDELVCMAEYYDEVEGTAHKWFTPPQENADEVYIKMRHVVVADLELMPISDHNKLPSRCNKQKATELGAVRLQDIDILKMQDEFSRREVLDYFEDFYGDDDDDDNYDEGDFDDGDEFEEDSDKEIDEDDGGYTGDDDGEDNESGDEEEEEEL